MRGTRLLSLLVTVLVPTAIARAQTAASPSFRLSHQSFNSSGGRASSASFRLTDCLGPEPEAGGKSRSSSFVLYAACAAAIPAGLATDDDDGDAVPNGVEDGAPNGDGNADGVADRIQSHVTSLPSATGQGYMTLEACADMACAPVCHARNVRALTESDLPVGDPRHVFPLGLLEFNIDCSPADIRILYHGLNQFVPTVEYVKFGPNPPDTPPDVFYVLPGVIFGVEAVGTDPAVASARFRLTDGAVGDDTGVDGLIFDQGGPGLPQEISAAPLLTPAGLVITLFVLVLVARAAWRRHRDSSETKPA